ncbi:MAG: hypothetical protein K8U57_27880 [Planctomycetes bacterium]|nr:hypothetical protein [Planctomycetota bacterium]
MEEDALRIQAQKACKRFYDAFGKDATQALVFEEYASPELWAIPSERLEEFIAGIEARLKATE